VEPARDNRAEIDELTVMLEDRARRLRARGDDGPIPRDFRTCRDGGDALGL